MNKLKLLYDDTYEIQLENWQVFAIMQVLGITIEEQNGEISYSYFPKDFVANRLKKMGVLVEKKEV